MGDLGETSAAPLWVPAGGVRTSASPCRRDEGRQELGRSLSAAAWRQRRPAGGEEGGSGDAPCPGAPGPVTLLCPGSPLELTVALGSGFLCVKG